MTIFCPECKRLLEVNLSPGVATEPSPYNPSKVVKVVTLEEHHEPTPLKTWVRVKGTSDQRMVDVYQRCALSGAKVMFV